LTDLNHYVATHFLTLRDPCLGRDPYFKNPWFSHSRIVASYKRILVHEFTRPHKFSNYLSINWVCSSLVSPLLV